MPIDGSDCSTVVGYFDMVLDVRLCCFIVPSRRECGKIVSVLDVSDGSLYCHSTLHANSGKNFSSKHNVDSLYICDFECFVVYSSFSGSSDCDSLMDATEYSNKSTWERSPYGSKEGTVVLTAAAVRIARAIADLSGGELGACAHLVIATVRVS